MMDKCGNRIILRNVVCFISGPFNKYVKHKFTAPLFGPLILQRKLDCSIAVKPIRVYYFMKFAHSLSGVMGGPNSFNAIIPID